MRAANSVVVAATCAIAAAIGVATAFAPMVVPSNGLPAATSSHAASRASSATRGEDADAGMPTWSWLPPGAAEAWGAKPVHGLDAMRTDFAHAARLDDFFERGLRSPADGGLFYARLAMRQCAALRNNSSEGSGPPADREVLKRARDRCGSLGDPASRERLTVTMQTAATRLDPALAILNTLEDKSRVSQLTTADVARALDDAIALGDPYVVRTILYRSIARAEAFDGRPVDSDLRRDLWAAARLASCDLGVDCVQESSVSLSCASKDGCAESLRTLVLADASMTDERRRAVSMLSLRMGDAGRDGSLSQLFR